MDSLKNAMENVEEYISSTPYDNTHLKDARDYLNNAMQGLKLEEKNFDKKSITIASK